MTTFHTLTKMYILPLTPHERTFSYAMPGIIYIVSQRKKRERKKIKITKKTKKDTTCHENLSLLHAKGEKI